MKEVVMFKAVVLIKKKRGMPMEEFKRYYEEHHAPLRARSVPNLRRYIRRYLETYGSDPAVDDDAKPYDVLTEIWFDNREEFEKGMAYLAVPETAAVIARDEERIFERESIRLMTIEEQETYFPDRPVTEPR
jgi:uncharacterized protein (TIGR02118 family)